MWSNFGNEEEQEDKQSQHSDKAKGFGFTAAWGEPGHQSQEEDEGFDDFQEPDDSTTAPDWAANAWGTVVA